MEGGGRRVEAREDGSRVSGLAQLPAPSEQDTMVVGLHSRHARQVRRGRGRQSRVVISPRGMWRGGTAASSKKQIHQNPASLGEYPHVMDSAIWRGACPEHARRAGHEKQGWLAGDSYSWVRPQSAASGRVQGGGLHHKTAEGAAREREEGMGGDAWTALAVSLPVILVFFVQLTALPRRACR